MLLHTLIAKRDGVGTGWGLRKYLKELKVNGVLLPKSLVSCLYLVVVKMVFHNSKFVKHVCKRLDIYFCLSAEPPYNTLSFERRYRAIYLTHGRLVFTLACTIKS